MKRKPLKRRKKMIEPVPPPPEEPVPADTETVTLSIEREELSDVVNVTIKAPKLAQLIRKMSMTHYPYESYDPVYKDILMRHPKDKDRAVTRAAIPRITKYFVGGTNFVFTETPRSILLSNPDALEAGYTLNVPLAAPVDVETVRKWGKNFMTGCQELLDNAQAYRMDFVLSPDLGRDK